MCLQFYVGLDGFFSLFLRSPMHIAYAMQVVWYITLYRYVGTTRTVYMQCILCTVQYEYMVSRVRVDVCNDALK